MKTCFESQHTQYPLKITINFSKWWETCIAWEEVEMYLYATLF